MHILKVSSFFNIDRKVGKMGLCEGTYIPQIKPASSLYQII